MTTADGALFDLSGRAALVTGACGGIGRALCFGLARQGAAILAADHPTQDASALADELVAAGVRAAGFGGDLNDPSVPDQAVAAALAAFGRVDVVVNNAGINLKDALEAVQAEQWHEMTAVNLIAPFLLARSAMQAQVRLGLPLSVVNVSSVAGTTALGRGNAGFGATKAGLNELTRELAVEWAVHGVRVNAVQPAQVAGPAFDRLAATPEGARTVAAMVAGIPLGRFVEPDELVGPVVFLASDASAAVTGTVLPVDGGNLALNAGGTIGS